MKKITKSFYTSFLLSLSAIFVADKLVFLPSNPAKSEIKLPPKNIALFIEKTNMQLPAQSTKSVSEGQLHAISKKREIILYDPKELEKVLSPQKEPESLSIAEASQIPIEAENKPVTTDILSSDTIISPPAKNIVKDEPKLPVTEVAKDKPLPEYEQEIHDSEQYVEHNVVEQKIAENDIIPIENGNLMLAKSKVEITEKAPKSQIAMIGDPDLVRENSAIKALTNEKHEEPREWNSMPESPWVVAKANQLAKNSKVAEDLSSEKTEEEITQLLAPAKMEEGENIRTAKVMKNILIPIPEDILNDENLEPQLVSPKKKNDKKEVEEDAEERPAKKKGFLKNIASIFGGSSEKTDDGASTGYTSGNTKNDKSSKTKNKAIPKILPAEMKLSFQPGRAQISGQTLRWIQAFALKATEDPDVILEIRIDKNSSYALQQRRLELLHTILGSKGIDDNKVNTVFTSREPNSFIIRTLRLSEETQNSSKNNKNKLPVYQTW